MFRHPLFLWGLGTIGVLVIACLLVLVMSHSLNTEMSAHGWAAMLAGASASILVGSGLTGLLVWSRRHGYDDAAHKAYYEEEEEE